MILNEEKYMELNTKFCKDIQTLFLDFIDDLEDSNCVDTPANEAIVSLGNNIGSMIHFITDDLETEAEKIQAHKIILEDICERAVVIIDIMRHPEKYKPEHRPHILNVDNTPIKTND